MATTASTSTHNPFIGNESEPGNFRLTLLGCLFQKLS
jgi:hypothetical protein